MSDPTKAVFLSYAHDDAAAARRIADALRNAGLVVWFDESELRGGDSWDQKIRTQIKQCALVLPVISANTQSRGEGYFRLEWKLAVERTHLMAEGIPFIAPIVIDDTRDAGAIVPAEFMRVQWMRLPGGLPTPNFVAQVERLLSAKDTPSTGERGAESGPAKTSSAAASRGAQGWLWPLAAVALAVVGYYFWQSTRPTAPAAAASSTTNIPARPELVERATSSDKSIAVLAFADMSEARNGEYFSDGISEELLNVLAKVPGLKVSARTSAFFFKGKNVPIPEIGEKLNVAYIVEGSVQRAGDRVKITAQLIKAADGFHVWSDTFTRDAKDVFAVQEEIAGRIAKELSLKLGVTSTSSSRAVDPRAFELYLLGRRAWNLRTVEGFDQAEKAFKEALAIEPDFARAHAALADVSLIRLSEKYSGRFDQRDSPELAKVTVMVERALALDPNLAEAHTSLGNLFWQSWRYEDAVRELRRAIALNPNYATAHQWLGRVLLAYGWIEEGEASLKRAAELDPLSHRILDNYSISLTLQQRDGEALAVLDRALALRPDSQQALAWKADTLSALGRHDEAVALVRRYPVADTVYAAGAVQILARAGLKKEANEALAHILAGGDSEVKFAGLIELGRMQEALDVLDPGAMGINGMGYYLFDPVFDPIRQNPRFVRMLATLGMTEAHARAQAWRAANPLKKQEAKK